MPLLYGIFLYIKVVAANEECTLTTIIIALALSPLFLNFLDPLLLLTAIWIWHFVFYFNNKTIIFLLSKCGFLGNSQVLQQILHSMHLVKKNHILHAQIFFSELVLIVYSHQALSKNGKVYGSDIMVGVVPCIEKVLYQ